MSVSSQDHANKCELPNGIWQSYGSQGQHWIRLEMQPDIVIKNLKVGVDPADSSYMPSVIIVGGGISTSVVEELNVVYVRHNDTSITILSNMDRVIKLSL